MTSKKPKLPQNAAELAKLIDHTALKPETTAEQIATLCEEAEAFGFGAVCVAPAWVSLASKLLSQSSPHVAAVVGFPHGDTTSEVKAYEASQVLAAGADELDMVLHVGMLRSGEHGRVAQDIGAVVAAARERPGAIVKVILETGLLTDDEKRLACRLAEDAGADFVKTSTGFGAGGATREDVALMRQCVGQRLGVKAAGGIRDLESARALVEAGANRLGCSRSVEIVQSFE